MYHHVETLNKLTHHDETKKRAHDSLIVRAKETSSWATVGPATDKHQAQTHRLKFYVRAVIESEAWPTVLQHSLYKKKCKPYTMVDN